MASLALAELRDGQRGVEAASRRRGEGVRAGLVGQGGEVFRRTWETVQREGDAAPFPGAGSPSGPRR